jgi:hypothetical protein
MGNKKTLVILIFILLLAGVVLYFFNANKNDENKAGDTGFFSTFNLMELLQNSKSNKPESKDFQLDTDIFSDPKYGQLKHDTVHPDFEQKPGKDNPFEPAE